MEPYLRINFGGDRAGLPRGMQAIAQAIAAQIHADGALAGSRLPPVRALAHQLGVSKNTVQAAYEELKAQGLVESRDRRGLFVAAPERSRRPRPRLLRVPAPPLQTLPSTSRPLSFTGDRLMMSTVFIDPRLLPRDKLAACFRAALRIPGLQTFARLTGFPPLRRAIAQRLKKRGIEADPEHIVTTVGSQQALDIVSRSLGAATVGTENPAYHMGKALFHMNGIRAVGLPVDPFRGVDLATWERILVDNRPALVYLTSNFQNPTGYSYSSAEQRRILEMSGRLGFGILEDDWGSDMLSFTEFKPSLRALGGDNVLYMNSFTKKLLPALRTGYVVGNAATVEALTLSKRVSTGESPAITEAAVFEFLDRGYYDAHLKRVQQELDQRYCHCLELLRAHMPDGVRWTSPGGGPILWLELPRRFDLAALARVMDASGIVIRSAREAFFGEPHLHGLLVGYAFLDEKEMERAVHTLARALGRQPRVPARSRAAGETPVIAQA